MRSYELLDKINSVDDLRRVPDSQINELAAELRDCITETTLRNGGHLSSNLGVVELTLVLHRIFDTPKDKLIWDVGHQCYAHKIITGRRASFATLRTSDGISGFTKRDESEFDPFGAGHSSTALSAAIGFATAARLERSGEYTIAVVGDGALTGGLTHEGLNNIDPELKLILIINDNKMSISKSTGGFAKHLSGIRSSSGYHKTKTATRSFIKRIPVIGMPLFKAIRSAKKHLKNFYFKSNYFEDMGLYYLGPVDGHDFGKLSNVLKAAKDYGKACVVHVNTVKGKGYAPAENQPEAYHGITPSSVPAPVDSFSGTLGSLLVGKAKANPKICAITAAMKDGCGLCEFAKSYPDRFFDVGIAEEHALVFAAGLAAGGEQPVFTVYSTFLQRGYDNIVHDIALQGLPVVTCIDRAGISCADGPTHNGIFDVAMLNQISGITLYAPIDYQSLDAFLEEALALSSPSFIRYQNGSELKDSEKLFPFGSEYFRRDFESAAGNDCFVITYGRVVSEALAAKRALAENGIACGIILLERLLPLEPAADAVLLALQDAVSGARVIFLEEGIKNGGCGECLFELIRSSEVMSKLEYRIRAIEDSFIKCRNGISCFASAGISAGDIVAEVISGKQS